MHYNILINNRIDGGKKEMSRLTFGIYTFVTTYNRMVRLVNKWLELHNMTMWNYEPWGAFCNDKYMSPS